MFFADNDVEQWNLRVENFLLLIILLLVLLVSQVVQYQVSFVPVQ